MGISETAANPAARVYARVWRWHFFAALIVVPFVLWQSVTGVLYLWHRELAAIAYPELLSVQPLEQRVSYDSQLQEVLKHQPRDRLEAIEASDDPTQSTAFYFRADDGLPYPAFVDPNTGDYLGAVSSKTWIRGLSRGLHGGWPINPTGSYLLELGASWAIMMALTGLYLWWPRNARGLAGVMYPRLRSGSRIFWRDLHAIVGVYFALILLSFLTTAMPWTTLWGGQVLAPIQTALNQESPLAFFFASGDHQHAEEPNASAHQHHGHDSTAPTRALTIDELLEHARAAGVQGVIELHPRFDGKPVSIRDDHPRAPDETWMQLDAMSGAVLTKVTWKDIPTIPRLVSLGIDLHEGRFFGRLNQIFNTLFAVALVWLSVTGFMGWYKRRPNGGLAAPPKRAVQLPKFVIALGAVLCVALPLLGVSVLLIALIDRAAKPLLPAST